MSVTNKISMVLSSCGKKKNELGDYLGLGSRQATSNKMVYERWNADDLIKVAKFTGSKIGFTLSDGTYIELTEDDLRK